MDISFVNRVKERGQLGNLLQTNVSANRAIFVCGKSGIGKTALVDNVLEKINNKHIYHVKTKHSSDYADGYFYRELAKSISIAKANDMSLTLFVQDLRSRVANKNAAINGVNSLRASIVDMIPNGVIKFVNALFDSALEIATFKEEKVLSAYDVESFALINEYVRYIFNQETNIVLHFENIQDIDSVSLMTLTELLKQQHDTTLILEYTTNLTGHYPLSELVDNFKVFGATVTTMRIGALSKDDIIKIIEQIPNAQKSIITGDMMIDPENLRTIIDYLCMVKYSPYNVEGVRHHDFTKEALGLLSSDERFVLSVILNHVEPVPDSVFDEAMLLHNIKYGGDLTKPLLQSLIDKGFVTEDPQRGFLVTHDYVSTSIRSSNAWNSLNILAQQFWYDYYSNPSQTFSVSNSTALCKQLFYAACLKQYGKVLRLLDDLYYEATKMISPDSLLENIMRLKDTLPKNGSVLERIDLWLITLHCSLGHYNRAYDIMRTSTCSGSRFTLMKIIVLDEIGNKEEALDICTEEINNAHDKTSGYLIALRSTRIMLNYVVGKYNEAAAEYHECISNDSYKDLFEYGYILRNAELIYSDIRYEQSLPPIWESVTHFRDRGATKMEAYSRMTYGVQSALAARFKKAEKQFEIAKKLLNDDVTERHSIFNNIAVVRMFQSLYDDETKWALQQALLTVKEGFDYTAIHVNQLALLDWRNEDDAARKIIPHLIKAVETRTYYNTEIVACAYFNIAHFYKKTGNDELYAEYIGETMKYVTSEDPLWNYRLHGIPLPRNHNNRVDASVNRALSFISNWHIDFDLKNMQYE